MGAGFDSLPAFARQLGWSRALIYQYVSGRVLVQLDRLAEIARETGKPLAWFLNEDAPGQAGEALAACERQVAVLRAELASEREGRLEQERHGRAAELGLRAQLCRALRRAGEAPALVEAAAAWLELARQAGEPRAALEAQLQMGHAWFLLGDLERARETLRGALAGAGAAGEETRWASARQELVRVAVQAGQLAEARQVAEELAAAEAWWPRWSGLLSLAAISAQEGDLAAAEDHLRAAAVVIETGEGGARRQALAEVYLLSNRVTVALVAGNYLQAGELNEQLRSRAAQAGVADQIREAELNRALIALRQGRVQEAEDCLQRLQEWAQLAGDRRLGGLAGVFSAELLRRCGDFAGARRKAQVALDGALADGQPQIVVEATLALAETDVAAGHAEEARYYLERAETRAGELGLARLQLQAQALLAETPGQRQEILARLQAAGAADLALEAALAAPGAEASALASRAAALGYFWGEHAALLAAARQAQAAGDTAAAAKRLAGARKRAAAVGLAACPALTAAYAAIAGAGQEH